MFRIVQKPKRYIVKIETKSIPFTHTHTLSLTLLTWNMQINTEWQDYVSITRTNSSWNDE